jgi:RNA polymerase sigma factor (sigma-70 family)
MAMPAPPLEPDPRHLRPDQLVRRYAHHRDRGDGARMTAAWEALCVKTYDRIRGIVQAFHFPGTHAGFPPERLDDAVQEAYLLVQGKAGKLRGDTPGEFYAALAYWVRNACMDYGRRELRHDRRIGGSFDEPGFKGETDRSRFDDLLEAEARRRDDDRLDKEEIEGEVAADLAVVAWGIAQIDNETYRTVLHMTYIQKLTADDIAEQLDVSHQTLYKRRSRGLMTLQEILRDRRP